MKITKYRKDIGNFDKAEVTQSKAFSGANKWNYTWKHTTEDGIAITVSVTTYVEAKIDTLETFSISALKQYGEGTIGDTRYANTLRGAKGCVTRLINYVQDMEARFAA